jgi:hypothetical protein
MDRKTVDQLTFNGKLDVGIRALAALAAFHPRPLTLGRLRLLDHFTVFAQDCDAGENAHVATSGRANAYGFRQPMIEGALALLKTLRLVEIGEDGAYSISRSDGCSWAVIACVNTDYGALLYNAADRIRVRCEDLGEDAVFADLGGKIAELAREPMEMPRGVVRRFEFLEKSDIADIRRMEGLWSFATCLASWRGQMAAAAVIEDTPAREWFDDVARAAIMKRDEAHHRIPQVRAMIAQSVAEGSDESGGLGNADGD